MGINVAQWRLLVSWVQGNPHVRASPERPLHTPPWPRSQGEPEVSSAEGEAL